MLLWHICWGYSVTWHHLGLQLSLKKIYAELNSIRCDDQLEY